MKIYPGHISNRKIKNKKGMFIIPKPRANEFPQEYIGKTKICKFCGIEKPYAEFYFQLRKHKSGLPYYYFNTRCIDCEKKAAIVWANENIEKKRESVRKNSYKSNIREFHKNNSQRQRDAGYMDEYYKNNLDKMKIYQEKRRHKKHKIKKYEWESCKKYFDYKCAYCGFPIEDHYKLYKGVLRKEDLHKEHIDHNGSIYLDNCIPSCHTCNESKHTATLEEWYNQSKPFYSDLRLMKINKWRTEDYKKYMTTIPILSIDDSNEKNVK